VCLRKYDIRPGDSTAVLDIVSLATVLLLVGCVIHFAYMLPHYWGRLAYMCVVFTIHSYAYMRLVWPDMWLYYTTKDAVRRGIWNDDDWQIQNDGLGESESNVSAQIQKMSTDAIVLNEMIVKHRITMHPDFFINIDELRVEFFAHCVENLSYMQAASVDDEFQVVYEMDMPPASVDVSCIVAFYNAIDKILGERTKKYSSHEEINANTIINVVRMQITTLYNTYLSDTAPRFIGISEKTTSRIQHGFRNNSIKSCDFDVLEDLRHKILYFLVAESEDTYAPRFQQYIIALSEKYAEKLNILCTDGHLYKDDIDPRGTRDTVFELVSMLRDGRGTQDTAGATGELNVLADNEFDIDDLYSLPSTEFDEPDDPLSYARDQNAPTTCQDEVLEDGSIIYSSPSRATYCFIVDSVRAMCTLPAMLYGTCQSRRAAPDDTVAEGLVQ